MNSLSQCMIVKNEEENIRQALSWGRDIMMEQIVVDTGSTDKTVEIAESMGARVYHFPWKDDFSAAKNFAISKASGDWIAFLDADEYIESEGVLKLKKLIETWSPKQYDACVFSMLQLNHDGKAFAAGSQMRVFANRPDIGYHNRIHEQLGRSDKKALVVIDATEMINIIHTGYGVVGEARERKLERNRTMILKELEEKPDDVEMLGYLGDTYYMGGKNKEAEEAYRKSIKGISRDIPGYDQRSSMTFINLMHILYERKCTEEEILEVYKEATARTSLAKDADFDLEMAVWYLNQRRHEEGLAYLQGSLNKLQQYGNLCRALYAGSRIQGIYEQIANCYLQMGRLQEAVRESTALLKEEPKSIAAILVLLESFRKGGVTPEQAFGFLGKLYDLGDTQARIFLMCNVRKLRWKELEELFYDLLSPEEMAAFEETAKTDASEQTGSGL